MVDSTIYVMCNNCQVKNRLSVRYLLAGPRCGRCRVPLLGSEMTGKTGPTSLVPRTAREGETGVDGDSP